MMTLQDYKNRENPIFWAGKVKAGLWVKVVNEDTGRLEERSKASYGLFQDKELVNILITYKLLREY